MARSQKQTFDSTAGGLASIPGQGTKIATSHKTKQKQKNRLLSEKINYRMMTDTISWKYYYKCNF